MRTKALAVLTLAITLHACGGSAANTANTALVAAPAGKGAASASISITIPEPHSPGSAARSPKYISSSTKSVSVDPGTGPQNFNLVAGAPG